MRKFLSALSVLLVLGACSSDESNNSSAAATTAAAPVEASKPAIPADPAIASIYKRSCVSCHATGAANAPRTGSVEDWAPRLEKGMDVMIESAINGMGGMPPMGLCMDCDEAQFEALINFMAGN